MKIQILTLFPEMFPGTLGHSLAGKALSSGLWSLETIQIRDFATDKHKTVDEKSYGGGTGLVMKPDVVGAAIDHAMANNPNATLIYPTPRGVPFTQELAYAIVGRKDVIKSEPVGEPALSARSAAPCVSQQASAGANIIFLCGRYEGVDQRVLDKYQPLEVSLGDYVLSGGEIAAQVLLDACIRLIPGVISSEGALQDESFSLHLPLSPWERQAFSANEESAKKAGEGLSNCSAQPSGPHPNPLPQGEGALPTKLLEYPQYTQPAEWEGRKVPEVLLSGNHEHIAQWRAEQALEITRKRRPDLLNESIDE